jgi:hypothetical protein
MILNTLKTLILILLLTDCVMEIQSVFVKMGVIFDFVGLTKPLLLDKVIFFSF